eukprot:m.165117 g.165117  ORF g.165117 m.165117 type:complete len:440 (+) comp14666_c0_seq5:1335-2654(+)
MEGGPYGTGEQQQVTSVSSGASPQHSQNHTLTPSEDQVLPSHHSAPPRSVPTSDLGLEPRIKHVTDFQPRGPVNPPWGAGHPAGMAVASQLGARPMMYYNQFSAQPQHPMYRAPPSFYQMPPQQGLPHGQWNPMMDSQQMAMWGGGMPSGMLSQPGMRPELMTGQGPVRSSGGEMHLQVSASVADTTRMISPISEHKSDGPAPASTVTGGAKRGRKRSAVKHEYICEVCDRTFSHSSNLTRHKRVHTGVKPYKCTHCDRAFANSSNRNTHEEKCGGGDFGHAAAERPGGGFSSTRKRPRTARTLRSNANGDDSADASPAEASPVAPTVAVPDGEPSTEVEPDHPMPVGADVDVHPSANPGTSASMDTDPPSTVEPESPSASPPAKAVLASASPAASPPSAASAGISDEATCVLPSRPPIVCCSIGTQTDDTIAPRMLES